MGFLEKLPVVLKFCYCLSLRAGSCIIGTLSLCTILTGYSGNVVYFLMKYTHREIDDEQVRYFLANWFLLLIYVMPKIILNLVLIVGATKKKSSLIGIYLWSSLVYTVLEVICLTGAAVITFLTDLLPWPFFVAFLTVFFLQIYFWICIDSYYVKLKLENRYSVRQQMRGAMLTFDPSHSTTTTNTTVAPTTTRQQSFPLRRLILKPHAKPPS